MALIPYVLRRACDGGTGPACEKPVSKTLLNVVPAAILGGVVLIAVVVLFVIIRRKRRQFKADEVGERESIEIDIYDSSKIHGRPYQGSANQNPFGDTNFMPRDSSYNEFSLAPPSPVRGPSPSRSFDTTDSERGHYPVSAPPPAYNQGAKSEEQNHYGSKA